MGKISSNFSKILLYERVVEVWNKLPSNVVGTWDKHPSNQEIKIKRKLHKGRLVKYFSAVNLMCFYVYSYKIYLK